MPISRSKDILITICISITGTKGKKHRFITKVSHCGLHLPLHVGRKMFVTNCLLFPKMTSGFTKGKIAIFLSLVL